MTEEHTEKKNIKKNASEKDEKKDISETVQAQLDTTTAIKAGDFVSLDFVGILKSTDTVFDTTKEDVAKAHGFNTERATYKPLIIKIGEGQLLKALDDFLVGKKSGNYHLDLPAELAFGKKDAKLLRLISIGEFRKHEIAPQPGLEVELDGRRGIVRTVNGGRVIVDFNHPLSSQDISYDLTVNGVIADTAMKVEAVLGMFQLPFKSVKLENNVATIALATPIPAELTDTLKKEFIRLTGVADILFQ